ncbi:Retrovirus-related Pol polyprotein from transposon TNT 1-94 [Penicillium digitatum]|uniref:Retrovirus-related Pol polyprotein from transposon TNT 1-94 n=1 Tax=Penicillium digitatum TaxID=36651 RepID=A0A7T7BKC7_PENDI|nr:Retrovirus-related Pol polyprotein from transposon TNT 1-94 [Penicillium digitatum]
MNQEHEHDSQDRHIPIDFLRPHLENPFNIRSTSPPSPTVEDDPEDQTRAPNALDPSNPALFEEDLAWSNDEMAGSFGRCVVEQRVDTGAHFEAGGRGVLVEPQPVSRQVVNMDIPLETTIDLSQEDPLQDDEDHDQSPLQHDQVTFEHNFSRLDPVPDDRSRDQSYVQPIQPIQPETGQLRRSTRIKKPSRAYIESLASKSFFDSNVLRLLAEQPEILISLFANATSNEQYAVSKLTPKDIGFEPNSW